MPSDHAKLSPSSAKRWFNCPGSIALIAALPESAFKSKVNAAEGTVAHSLAEELMTGKLDFMSLVGMIGKTVRQDGFDIKVTDELVEGIVEYDNHVEEVKKRFAKPGAVHELTEHRVKIKIGNEEIFGTADKILFQKGNELHVFDFKFGKKVVEAEENEQGSIYVCAALEDPKIAGPYDKLFFHIVQPRGKSGGETVRTWEIPQERLQAFKVELVGHVGVALNPEAPRVPGEKWCHFCPGLAYCPEVKKSNEALAKVTFTRLPPAPEKGKALPAVELLTGENIAQALAWEDTFDSWYKALRIRAQEELRTNPDAIPGYKLVKARTNRRWKDEKAVVEKFGLLGDKIWAPRKLLSPAQIEKIAGKDEVAPLTEKPEGELTVAPTSDKRDAVRLAAPSEVFGALPAPAAATVDLAWFGDFGGGSLSPALAPAPKKGPIWPQ